MCPSRTATGRPPTAAASTGVAGCLCLDGDQAEGLAVGRHDEHRGGAEPVRELVLADGRAEADHVRDAQAGGELLQALGLGKAAAAGAADDRDDDAGAQVGALVEEDGDRAQEDVRGLQGLDAAREERDERVLRETQAGAGCRAAVRGAEAVEVDAGVDDGDLAGVGGVVPYEFVGLLRGVRDEAVGRLDDLGLADDPGGGLGVSPSARLAFLTLAMVCMACTRGRPSAGRRASRRGRRASSASGRGRSSRGGGRPRPASRRA